MERTPAFDLKRPATIAEAVMLLASDPRVRLLAGGTDLLPRLRRGIERPEVLVDLASVRDFARVVRNDAGLTLGAGVTLAQLAADDGIARDYAALSEAARAVAGPGHRSAATIGGNLCLDTRCIFYNQSEWWRAANGYCLKRGGEVCHVAPQGKHCHAAFCSDLAPALLVLGAEVELMSRRELRRIALADLYRDNGAAHLTFARDELLTQVLVPKPPPSIRAGFRKARARGAVDFPLAGVACTLALQDGCITVLRVALTGTNSRPITLADSETLIGRAVDDQTLALLGKLVQKQVSPMRTTVTQSNYRRQVAAVLAQRLVRELARDGSAHAEKESLR